jgi:hypothetical protein
MARWRVKGGGKLDRRREEERGKWGAGPVCLLACYAGSGEMGQMANEPVKKKRIKI